MTMTVVYHDRNGTAFRASGVLCSDGIYRTVQLREPDTYFTAPASTRVKGKYITGFVSNRPTPLHPNALYFTPYDISKNAKVLPEWEYVSNEYMARFPMPPSWMEPWRNYMQTLGQSEVNNLEATGEKVPENYSYER